MPTTCAAFRNIYWMGHNRIVGGSSGMKVRSLDLGLFCGVLICLSLGNTQNQSTLLPLNIINDTSVTPPQPPSREQQNKITSSPRCQSCTRPRGRWRNSSKFFEYFWKKAIFMENWSEKRSWKVINWARFRGWRVKSFPSLFALSGTKGRPVKCDSWYLRG